MFYESIGYIEAGGSRKPLPRRMYPGAVLGDDLLNVAGNSLDKGVERLFAGVIRRGHFPPEDVRNKPEKSASIRWKRKRDVAVHLVSFNALIIHRTPLETGV